MSEPLPLTIVTLLEEFGRALLALSRVQADRPLLTLERAVLGLVREFLPRLLAVVLALSQSSLQPAARRLRWRCPACGVRAPVHSWRPRTVLTVCGMVTFARPWCVCPACGHGCSPTDGQLALASRARLSPGVQEWAITLGARETFAEAATTLATLTGLAVSAETVRQLTEARGQAIEAADAVAVATVQRTREAAEPVDPAPGTLLVETDGVMVRYRRADRKTEWHEVKVGYVAGFVDGEVVAPSYVAAREPVEQFGPRLLTEAARRGALDILEWVGSSLRRQIARLRSVTVLADGAKWIWNLAADHFDCRTEILDWYHATEHLWTVARAVFGEGTSAARDWVKQQERDLWEHGSAPLLAALKPLRAPTAEGQEVLRVEKGYFRNNADRMDYPTFRAAALPIGSGAVESSGKHVIQHRMKRPGASWSDAGAQGVIAVRCRLLSNRPLAA